MAACSIIYLVNSKQKAGFEFHVTAGILSLRGEHCLYGVEGGGGELELSAALAQSVVSCVPCSAVL